MSSIINIRVPARLKRAAKKIAEANGLDLSSCIRMFLVHMEIRGTVPLPHLTVNGFTEEEEDEVLRRWREEPRVSVAHRDKCRVSHKKLRAPLEHPLPPQRERAG